MKPKPQFFYPLLYLLISVCPASTQDIYFKKVLPPEGKTFVHVAGIVQDEQGYMWLATKKGLFRYDGYMISDKNDPSDSTALSTDALEPVCIDRKGMIWIATLGEGIERFDPATCVFTHFRPDPQDTASLGANWIMNLLFSRCFYRIAPLYLLCMVFLVSRSLPVCSQNVSFKNITPPKDLPLALITGITQDNTSYKWFTSDAVLYRYRGYEFTTCKHDLLNPNSLAYELKK